MNEIFFVIRDLIDHWLSHPTVIVIGMEENVDIDLVFVQWRVKKAASDGSAE